MKDIEFSFEDPIISQQRIIKTAERLKPEIRNMANVISEDYESDLASLYLPDERHMLNKVKQAIGKNLQLKPVYLIVDGIGGSNLGDDSCSGSCSWKALQSIDDGYKGVIRRHSRLRRH